MLNSKEYWLSVGKGAAMAAAGAVAAYVTSEVLPKLSEDPTLNTAIMTAVLGALVNAIRKWLTEQGNSLPPFNVVPFIAAALIIPTLTLGTPSTTFAASPKAVITGPRTARCGDRIVLDASDSTGETYEWDVACTPPLGEDRDQPETIEDGAKLLLPSYPGSEYTVTLVVAGIDELMKPRASITRWRVSVEGHGPGPSPPAPVPPNPNPPAPTPPTPEPQPNPPAPTPPTPEPQPNPPAPTPPQPPAPPAPAPLSEIARQVKGWVESVQSPGNRRAEAEIIAGIIDTVSARVAAGVISAGSARELATKVAAELAIGLAGKLGASQGAWRTSFDGPLGMQVGQLFLAGQLNTSEQWVSYLREVSVGLRAAS